MNPTALRHYPAWLLVVISVFLLSLPWYIPYTGIFLFAAFVPLLQLEAQIRASGKRFPKGRIAGAVYVAVFLWNLATTWWVYNASPEGTAAMLIANSLLMVLPFVFYSYTKQVLGLKYGLMGWVLYWLSFEYLHLNWDLNWPWLNLGNAFAFSPEWIQWYELTGTLGGSLWVLVANAWLYLLFTQGFASFKSKKVLLVALWIALPLVASYVRYFTYQAQGQEVEIVVVQPNIDPYQEKFPDSPRFIPFDEQIQRFIKLSEQAITPNTRLVAWPETAIDAAVPEDQVRLYPFFQKIEAFANRHPEAALLTGLTTIVTYPNANASPTARQHQNLGYYDVFNTAMFLQAQPQAWSFYHKSKLVPAVEAMPYPAFFKFLSTWMIDLGGTSGGYGKQAERTVFTQGALKVAPLICYESIFGEFVGDYVKKEANLLCVITNDGWWGNTPGHRQHLAYASLRAIEMRRDVARSANTGISAFINQRGDILQPTRYWEQAVLRANVRLNESSTTYLRYGDYLGRIGSALAAALLLSAFVRVYSKKIGR
jgi:apolipoprotein N-acyltransferase